MPKPIRLINPNQMFEDYVFHSLLYYALDTSVISDYEFDKLCRDLLAVWPQVTHPDRGVTDESALQAGTGFQIGPNWPQWAINRAHDLGIEHWWLDARPRSMLAVTPKGYYTAVGSRGIDDDMFDLMFRIGQRQCDLGFRGRSGGAPGSDTAFWMGAQDSERFNDIGFDVYLPNSWMFNKPEFGNLKPDPAWNIYDATTFDNYEEAQQLAFEARGSFEGLGKGGVQLHTRNSYQVLGHDLKTRSASLVCWAIPVGKQGKVKGGTNTAVQIALKNAIPVYNLYLDDVRQKLEDWLKTPMELK